MQIRIASIPVADQDRALSFYTEILGFRKHADIPMGDDYRWLTVVSPDGVEGVELALEPALFEPAQVYQRALYDAGIPATAFITSDVDGEFEALRKQGVAFRGEPEDGGPIRAVMFDDTCGNLIHLIQPLL